MLPGPIFRRELRRMAARPATFRSRIELCVMVLGIIGVTTWGWDYAGWDRATPDGMRRFGVMVYVLLSATVFLCVFGAVPPAVVKTLTEERERKSLDAVLTTRMTSLQIVLGFATAGLAGAFNGLGPVLPIAVLSIPFGGVPPRYVGMTIAATASLSLALTGVSAATAIESATTRRAMNQAASLNMLWMFGPLFWVLFVARWLPGWLVWSLPAAVFALDASPLAPLLALTPIRPRVGGVEDVFIRMIPMQVTGGTLLLLWCVWRLRPACRGVYDGEGRLFLRRAMRQARRRPACGDDPILWKERYTSREYVGRLARLADRVVHAALLTAAVAAILWFAAPALRETLREGYRPARDLSELNVVHPIARLLVMGRSAEPPAGLGRVEFNLLIRQFGLSIGLLLPLALAAGAASIIPREKTQDTWPGVLATPLTGGEIIRSLLLGVFWRMRWWAVVFLAAMLVGVVVGSVHPAGFVLATLDLAACAWLAAAVGMYQGLWQERVEGAMGRTLLIVGGLTLVSLLSVILPPRATSVGFAAVGMPMQLQCAVLSYEDVQDLARGGEGRLLPSLGVRTGEPESMALFAVVLGTAGQGLAAWWLTRAAIRGFDEAVGRPYRPVEAIGARAESATLYTEPTVC